MELVDMLFAQLTDLFRIGLIVMLVLTATRTSASIGSWVPLALGVVFVAVLIPLTLGSDQPDKPIQMAVGLVSNAIILAVVLAAKAALAAAKRPKS